MKEKQYCVYIHTNKTNQKVYIGITCQIPEKRWARGQKYKECPYFWSAIQKYGWEAFDHTILASGLTHDKACAMEIELIQKYKANDPQYGYNIREGGDGFTSEQSRALWNDESFKNYACERMKESWKDPEKRKRRSEAAKQRWGNPEFKKFAVQKVIEAVHRKVRCVETGEIFNGAYEVAENMESVKETQQGP